MASRLDGIEYAQDIYHLFETTFGAFVMRVFGEITKKLVASWFLLLVIAAGTQARLLILVALSLSGAMPFLVAVLWLGLSERGKRIRSVFEVWHLRMLSLAMLFTYGVYGRKWAGDVINELFSLDARFFGITSTVLTVLFTPFGVLYRIDLLGNIFDLFNVTAGLVILIYGIYLFGAAGVEARAKKFGYLLLAVVVGMVVLTLALNIAKSFKPAVRAFAIWADFNEHHPCMDTWESEAKGVVFLDNGKVLGYFPQRARQLEVVSCDYAKKL